MHCINASALSVYEDTSDLLQKAQGIYVQHPGDAIVLAKKAYRIAQKKSNKTDEVRSLTYETKFFWQARSYDSAKMYGRNALLGAEKYHIDSLQGDAWLILGIIDQTLGNYPQAIEKYNKAIPFYKKSNLTLKVAKCYLDMGMSKKQLSQYNEAIKYYLLASSYFENLKDSVFTGNTYNSIALCFVSLKYYSKAILYNKKALTIRKALNDTASIAQTLCNIGFAYKQYYKPDSAILYLDKSLAMQKQDKNPALMINSLQNLGSAWRMKSDFKKAESYISRSLTIATNYGMKEEFARGNLDLAELYTAQKRYKEALAAAKITESTAKALKLPELLMNAYAAEFNLYRQQHDYKNALLYDAKRDTIKDTLLSIAKDKAINELEIKYQTDLKEKDIVALNLQNTLQSKTVGEQRASIIALIVAAVLLLALFVITYNNVRIKNNANARIKLLMRDLHHRVKNNLQILSSLFILQIDSLNDENTKTALRDNESRLASMNLIHSKLYLDDTSTEIEMQEYLTKLLHHIKGSFGGQKERDITLTIDVEALMIDADKAVAIGLIVNELTTNSFKYAFDGADGEIFLSLKQPSKSKLQLIVGDNGKGMPDANEKKNKSFGLKLVKMMVRQLSAEMVVKNDNGTVYEMEIGV
jgi:two-component sensor histidine kinase